MTIIREKVKQDARSRRSKGVQAALELLNMGTVSTSTGSTTLDANGGANDQVVFTITLSHNFDQYIHAFPQWTAYADSVTDGNQVRDGSSIDRDDFEIDARMDWYETDGNNLKLKVFIVNLDASSRDVYIKVNWRYIVHAG